MDDDEEFQNFLANLPPVAQLENGDDDGNNNNDNVEQPFDVDDLEIYDMFPGWDGNVNDGAGGDNVEQPFGVEDLELYDMFPGWGGNVNDGAGGENANEGDGAADQNPNDGADGADENAPVDNFNYIPDYNALIDYADQVDDVIGLVDPIFGHFVRQGARLPVEPPPVQPPPLFPGQVPLPRVMPSVLNFPLAMQAIQADVQQIHAQGGNNLDLVRRVNNNLRVMSVSFQMLSQNTASTSRHPRTGDSLLDYLGLTRQQTMEHANISRYVFEKRLRDSIYHLPVGWPLPGNETTMPICIFYRTGFHALMYSRRQITFIRLRREVAAVCNTVVGDFTMRYNNGAEFVPLEGAADWGICNELYENMGMIRLDLLVAGNP